MNNALLYIMTVLIGGTGWFAIKLQIGHAPHEISILYRAVLAALFLLIWCKIKGFSLRFKLKDHFSFCGLGLSMFSLHYIFVFNATQYLVSGVIAVAFSSVSFLSILNNFLFFRIKPSFNITLGALIGFVGLSVFFWNDMAQMAVQNNFIKGLLLTGTGTVIFSLGGSISKRNNSLGLEIIPSMTMGLVYGALAMLIYTLTQSTHFVFPESSVYWASLLYLVIPGSIVAFLCYLKLIKNLGPELAGYHTVLNPIVALVVSWALEGYDWSLPHLVGLAIVIIGNVLVMRKKPLLQMFVAKPIPTELS
jgi:drug/metabolite transporter (DMT)-like permease